MEKNIPYSVYEASQDRMDRIIRKLTTAIIISTGLLFASNVICFVTYMGR